MIIGKWPDRQSDERGKMKVKMIVYKSSTWGETGLFSCWCEPINSRFIIIDKEEASFTNAAPPVICLKILSFSHCLWTCLRQQHPFLVWSMLLFIMMMMTDGQIRELKEKRVESEACSSGCLLSSNWLIISVVGKWDEEGEICVVTFTRPNSGDKYWESVEGEEIN